MHDVQLSTLLKAATWAVILLCDRLLLTTATLRRVDRTISLLGARRSVCIVFARKFTDGQRHVQFVLMAQWSDGDCSLDVVCSTLKVVSLSFTTSNLLPRVHQQAAEQLQFRLLH